MKADDIDAFRKDGVKAFNVLLPELMSNLLHNLPGIAYRCKNDSKWTMLFLSEGCYSLTGYYPSELLYNSERSYDDIIYEEDRDLVRNAVNEGVKKRCQFQIRYRIVDRQMGVRWVWEQGNAVYDENGNPFFLDGFIADINAIKRTEDELEQSARLLSELNVMKDKFFATIAHDLQNPIYAIISLSDFVYQNVNSFKTNELVDFIRQINSSAQSAHTLLENLLDRARSQTGKIRVQNQRLNMANLIDECIDVYRAHANGKNISIVKDIPDDLYVHSDPQLLSTIFRNLISNAIKFSFTHTEVHISAGKEGAKVFVQIRDHGIGISRSNVPKLFKIDGDYRNLGTANESGTGLGLILVRDFLNHLNGDIEVSSIPNTGSTFWVWLRE